MAKEPQFTSAQSHSARVPSRDEASSSDQATRPTARLPSTQDALDAAYDEYCQRLANGEALDHDRIRAACLEWEDVLTPSLAANDNRSGALGCPEPAWPQVGDELLGFRLLEELGRGAFARVFRATDTQLGARQVALKLCHTDSDEAWILGRLEHPHIVPVYSAQRDAESGLTAICMPYLGRVTLHDVISMSWKSLKPPQRITLSGDDELDGVEQQPPHGNGNRSVRSGCYLDVMLHVGASIAEALAHAHSKGVLHLDVKPSNVLVNGRGCARLMDFNLAADKSKGVPRIGGTLPYMSPEQASCFLEGRDGCDLDERSDVFSLGVMLYQMLCGHLPYGRIPERLSSRAVMEDLVNAQRLNRLLLWSGHETIHPRIRRVVERCLAIDPDKRYPSVAAVAKDLKRELSPLAKAGRWVNRHRSAACAMAGIVMVVGCGVAAGLSARDPYPVRQSRAGRIALEAREYDQAIEYLSSSLQALPDQFETRVLRAKAYVGAGLFNHAIEDLLRADKLREDGECRALLAYCCSCVDSYAQAIGLYEEARRLGYEPAGLLNNLGFCYHLMARPNEAEDALTAAIEKDGKMAVAVYNRAVVRSARAIREGHPPDEAMRDIDAALSMGSCSANVYYSAAVIYGYACSLDSVWKPRARKFIALAIENGLPTKSVTTDHFLASLCDELDLTDLPKEKHEEKQRRFAAHFVYPFE